MAQRLLIADDDNEIRELLEFDLSHSGYEVDCAKDGEEALQKALIGNYDLVLLDVMMPKMNGFDVCNNIRKAKLEVPILMLTAKGTITDKTQGFDMGADDYIVKPFEPVEVIARINAHLRREETKASEEDSAEQVEITVDNISINLDKYEVKLDGELITDLKPKEVQLLYFFLTNRNQVFSREQLLDKVWGYEYYGGTRTVDVHIKSVREKLSSPNNKWEIKTIWNVGYKFEVK